ncbi:MAG: regulatory iron-sulfur-containing complex subunit RicT [Dehalogenimonas sp.]|jgi:cell fate regulator YaaT (PSP1 superfamily)|uniref:Regulatory iron-sulfur-containing complex subunit RicT n=1 Tax=Candidatus Dehalogenimonas loeffleri TaxID=3127115 RepID=A0ABZ2J2Y7_9CHLR|nr:regulatory iron-sulfur-containing complex subunit RicT [Dehalogenimonas sp.]
MPDVVDIRFKKAGKAYTFDCAEFTLKQGDLAVVETVRGLEVGKVIAVRAQEGETQLESPLKPVIRLATDEDMTHKHHICQSESQALEACREQVSRLNLPMKCLGAEYNLDESHVTIFFSAEGRIDFRELVRELGRQLHVRVELRQIGPRDEAKLLGGFGRCGREFCCSSYLSEFEPVSIKMAKEQNLPLNPLKISGVCGRLLCCLGHEYEVYRQLNQERAACACQAIEAKPMPVQPSRRPVRTAEPEKDLPNITDDDNTLDIIVSPLKEPEATRPPRRRRRKR